MINRERVLDLLEGKGWWLYNCTVYVPRNLVRENIDYVILPDDIQGRAFDKFSALMQSGIKPTILHDNELLELTIVRLYNREVNIEHRISIPTPQFCSELSTLTDIRQYFDN